MDALRARPLALLGLGVLAVHLWVVAEVAPAQLGEGSAAGLRRMEVAFVRELAPTAPPVAPAAPAPPPRRAAPPPAVAASAPEPVAPPEPPEPPPPPQLQEPVLVEAPVLPPDLGAAPPPTADALPTGPVAAAPDAALAPASAAAPAAFDWPPSTRLSYRLTGNVRGPVEGQARVEWLRQGTRYQVFMDASVGPAFAPLFTRRDSSEGEITPEGLSPRRYELEQKVVLRDPRRQVILLEGDRIRLPTGAELARPAGVQDAVSQFVHLTWLFTTQPQRLRAGSTVELTLALPRRVEPWTYDIGAVEPLDTPAGRVDTVHVKPRREPRPGGDFVAELWVAPTLQYLPVRIVVRQDAETFVDLVIERLPQQAAEAPQRPLKER